MNRFWLALTALFWLAAGPVMAHDARPLSITFSEQAAGLYRLNIVVPPSVTADNQPALTLPDTCRRPVGTLRHAQGVHRGSVTCEGGLAGKTVGIRYALFNPSLSTVIRLQTLGGHSIISVLPPLQMEWTAPLVPDAVTLALDYLTLGMEHIFGGIDHLLFVTGLLLLAGTWRRALLVITGFTIAHSITLSLSALNVITVPVVPTEAAIALSILFLASEIARDRRQSLSFRYPLLVSGSFGLLHGLGFASALKGIGLPQGDVVIGLLFFNLGVEAGQIAFVLPLMGFIWLLRRWVKKGFIPDMAHARTLAAYGLGIPAAFWFIERVSIF